MYGSGLNSLSRHRQQISVIVLFKKAFLQLNTRDNSPPPPNPGEPLITLTQRFRQGLVAESSDLWFRFELL